MSSRARRLAHGSDAAPFFGQRIDPAVMTFEPPPLPPAPPPVDAARIEREAFMKGYAQGERAGAEAAAARGDAVVRRLTDTVDELRALKGDLVHRTEQQVVQLALAIARRIIHREVSLDRELILTMGRLALERLGTTTAATIRLHPDDYAAVTSGRGDATARPGDTVIVADPLVRRGGCLVQSEFGLIDLGVDAQVDELAVTLLGEARPQSPDGTHDLTPVPASH